MEKQNNEFDLQKKCWNKYKEIHLEKISYLQNIYKYFNSLAKILFEFETKYKALGIEKIINPIENNKINETVKLINKSIISFTNINETMTKNILNSFKDINELIKNENVSYDTVLLTLMQYDEEKQKMNQYKKSFEDKMIVIENFIKSDILKNNSNKIKSNIKIDKKDMNDAMKEFINYRISVGETNKKRQEFNKSQNNLLKLYEKVIIDKEADLYQKMNMNFYTVQKTENDSTSLNMEKMKDKKKVNKKEYNKEIISQYMSDFQPDQEINVGHYNIKEKSYPTFKDCTPDDVLKASQLSENIIRILRNNILDNYPDCNLQIQESELNLPDIIKNYLEIKIEPTDDEKNEIIKLIRDDITIYPQFLTMLSRLRANSKLFKSKNHIQFLEYIINEILIIAENKKDYNAVKNCILLSQTYYIKDEKTDTKIYLFEKIKNNKWIKTVDFWREFILREIKKEFNRYESLYPDQNLNLENNNTNLDKKYLTKVREIMFTCLISHISNMVDFNIDRRLALKLLDEFVNKYQYLDNNNIKELCNLISTDQEEINKLRKEYQENSNLENELK